jgi:hypothetical protein
MRIRLSSSAHHVSLTIGQRIAVKEKKDKWFIGEVKEIGKKIKVLFNDGDTTNYLLTDEPHLIPISGGNRPSTYTDSEIERLKVVIPPTLPPTPPSILPPTSASFVDPRGNWITQNSITKEGVKAFVKWYLDTESIPHFEKLARKITSIKVMGTAPVVSQRFYLYLDVAQRTLYWNDSPPSPSLNYPELDSRKVKTITSNVAIPLLRRELGKLAWTLLFNRQEAALYKQALLEESSNNKFVSRFHKALYQKYIGHLFTEDQYVQESFAECCRFYDDLHLIPQQGPIFQRLFLLLT